MPDNLIIPSVDLRIGALEEYNRQQKIKADRLEKEQKPRPCITISREYGCEAYPVAEKLCELMKQKTGQEWLLMDKALFEEVARCQNLSTEALEALGENNYYLNEFMATFSSRWGSYDDHFRLLSRYILSLAEKGNVIIVGRGGAIVTRRLKNCRHFRLFGSMAFKIKSMSDRLQIPPEDAEKLIRKKQKQRDRFNRDFLDLRKHDLHHYDLLFNNDRAASGLIAGTIADYVLKQ